MNQKTLIFIIIGIIVFLGVLILSQEKTIEIEKEVKEILLDLLHNNFPRYSTG